MISRLRPRARDRLREQLALALKIDADSKQAHRLARYGLALVDGAFVAQQADGTPLADVLDLLPRSVTALHRSLR